MSEPIDAATRVRTLIALTEELTDIFTRENQCLAARRVRDIEPMQVDKARLAAAYAQSIRDIACDRTLISGAGGALIERLREITHAFETRAHEQHSLLEGARAATEGVLGAIVDEASVQIAGYGQPEHAGASAAARALAIDSRT